VAYVKVGQVKSTLGKAVKYITNPEKTLNYALVTTTTGDRVDDSNAIAQSFLRNVEQTKGGTRRRNAVLAHHIIQSFDPEDHMSAEQAHHIGVRFIEELTAGSHDYVIATHVDKDHIHNHILLCPASNVTHKAIRVQKNTLKQWRKISDQLCEENGLNVIIPASAERTELGIAELYLSARADSFKDAVRTAIDRFCERAATFESFVEHMRTAGIDVGVRGQHLTFTVIETGQRIRDTKLGVAYNEMSIMSKLNHRTLNMISFNDTMIAKRSAGAISVWMPGSSRSLQLTIPIAQVVRDGHTWRAYLADDVK
jgi:hypothetical protein